MPIAYLLIKFYAFAPLMIIHDRIDSDKYIEPARCDVIIVWFAVYARIFERRMNARTLVIGHEPNLAI